MHVLKTLLAQVKEFTRDSILTPIFMLVEVAMEMVIPLLMASGAEYEPLSVDVNLSNT